MSREQKLATTASCSDLKLSANRALSVCLGLTAVLILLFAASLATHGQLQDERTVKAAFVFNLTKYVEWQQPNSDLVIGVIGEGPMGETLKTLLEGRSSDNHTLRVLLAPTEAEIASCSMLYFSQSASKKAQLILERMQNKSVLTVGETESFVLNGGIIALIRAGDEVQIHVNLEAARAAHLSISSRLLDLSKIVRKPEGKS